MEKLKRRIENYRKRRGVMKELFKDLIDNDTLIILGLLIVLGFMVKDVQLMIVGGLLTALKAGGKK